MMIDTICVYILDMSHSSNTSGVDRHIGLLLRGFCSMSGLKVYWVNFLDDKKILFPREEKTELCVKYTIPLPSSFNTIITERFWLRKYNEQVYRLIKHLFVGNKNCILHVHTLNLIDLAVYIRERINCKIITHLHCIPWKSLYNTDKRRFNKLYKTIYVEQTGNLIPEICTTNNCEQQAYSSSDALICVTHCAEQFVRTYSRQYSNYIRVIPNGISDFRDSLNIHQRQNHTFRCLFVGVVTPSKGIEYILRAMLIVQEKGYNVALTVAGACSSAFRERLRYEYSNLDVDVRGRVSFDELKKLYQSCNVGVIASLQEQSSYVAIEMAMFGLPIITTSVDGLDEMFTDKVDALKVRTLFSPILGLSVDVEMMASQIIRLIEDNNLQMHLSQQVRLLYEQKFNLNLMIQQIVEVYKALNARS